CFFQLVSFTKFICYVMHYALGVVVGFKYMAFSLQGVSYFPVISDLAVMHNCDIWYYVTLEGMGVVTVHYAFCGESGVAYGVCSHLIGSIISVYDILYQSHIFYHFK